MYALGLYKRVPGGPIPFVLFNAHDSQLQVPFLRYVNDEEHKWKVCIGLPNGTGKWQVGDSSKQNGQWKTEMTREKGKLVLESLSLPELLTYLRVYVYKNFPRQKKQMLLYKTVGSTNHLHRNYDISRFHFRALADSNSTIIRA
jgi:hypothetical protein